MHSNHYPFNLIRAIFGEDETDRTHTDTVYLRGFYKQLKTLDEAEQACLSMRYEKGMTLKACGEQYGKSSQWASTAVQRALRKMKRSSRSQHYLAVPVAATERLKRQHQQVIEENQLLQEALQSLNLGHVDPHAIILLANMLRPNDLTAHINVLGLSSRASNGLLRAGLLTVKDVISVPEDVLVQTRNIGEKSVQEIKAKIKAYILLPESIAQEEQRDGA